MATDFPWRSTLFGLLDLAELELSEADAGYQAALARATWAKNAQVQFVQKMHTLPARASTEDREGGEG